MLIRIWQFRARADKMAEFRAAYGPGGDWASLFRRAPGYSGTELLESITDPTIFVTLDRWESAAAWEAFRRAWSEAYTALDRKCKPLVHDEAEVGTFHSPAFSQRMSLETSRLTLRPCSPADLLALIDQPERFEQLAGLHAAEGLRTFFVSGDVAPAWLAALRDSAGPDPWRHGFFVIHRESQSVIGTAGFKGPPDSSGMVEIAYGIVPGFEGQGYATEAAAALVDFAFANGRVRLVRAHTLPASNRSTRVLEKCGFRCTGTVVDPEDGPVWRWERDL